MLEPPAERPPVGVDQHLSVGPSRDGRAQDRRELADNRSAEGPYLRRVEDSANSLEIEGGPLRLFRWHFRGHAGGPRTFDFDFAFRRRLR